MRFGNNVDIPKERASVNKNRPHAWSGVSSGKKSKNMGFMDEISPSLRIGK
jgi:hypothetical protein